MMKFDELRQTLGQELELELGDQLVPVWELVVGLESEVELVVAGVVQI